MLGSTFETRNYKSKILIRGKAKYQGLHNGSCTLAFGVGFTGCLMVVIRPGRV